MDIENPPGFIIGTEAQKAAFDNGFRLERGIESGWLHYASTTAQGEIWIAAASGQGPWFLSLSHIGVVNEIKAQIASELAGPGIKTFIFSTLSNLYEALDLNYRLSVSLPDAPLRRFQSQTAGLPETTEVERVVIQRIGQNLFRDALMEYWNKKCPITGITDAALLRASHIVAWSDCNTDAQRLDVYNGLLLSALWDAAFDKGLVSFDDEGGVLVSDDLSLFARQSLKLDMPIKISNLTTHHKINLAKHRIRHRFNVVPH